MVKEKTGKISILLFLLWFALIPIFWRLDISKGTYGSYDTYIMAPYGVFHLVIFYAMIALSIHFRKLSLYHLLLLSLYFPAIQLVNYPYLTFRDVYLHAAPAKTIVVDGQLLSSTDPLPASWPTSFNLHSILTIVSGCDLIDTNYILYLSSVIAMVLVAYSFWQLLRKRNDYRLAWASPILFLCFFFNHLDPIVHYSRTTLAFTFLFYFFLLFMCLYDRRWLIPQMLMVLAVVTTHPFQSFVLVAFLCAYLVLSDKNKPVGLTTFSIVAFFGWMLFQSSASFVKAIGQLKEFFSPHYVTPIAETFLPGKTLPWWTIILREYYKYSFLALLAITFLASIIALAKIKRQPIIVGLSSLFFSSAVMLVSLLLLPWWRIPRFTIFAAFPTSFSSFILFEEILKKGNVKKIYGFITKKSTLTILLLFVISLSAVVMVLRFEKNYYYGEVCHPSEFASVSFFFTHDHNSTITVVSWRTSVYSTYLNYNSSHQVLRLWHTEVNKLAGNSSRLLFQQSQLINQSQFVLRGMRDGYTLGRQDSEKAILRVIDEEIILPKFNPIYSNGYYVTYERALSP